MVRGEVGGVIEVRCCCDAHLIGWMWGGPWERGVAYNFLIPPASWIGNGEPTQVVRGETLTFDCMDYRDLDTGEQGVALRSSDYPLEKLRRIMAFEEAGE